MTEYKKLQYLPLPSTGKVTAENKYWKSFQPTATHKHFTKVTDIKFSPQFPHDVAVCASTRITVYDCLSTEPTKTISRFKDVALSCAWRADAKVLAAGGEDSLIQIFEMSSRSVLRHLKGHEAAVHSVAFTETTKLISGSDDRTVRLWDIPTQREVSVFRGHTDYIRSVSMHHQNENVLISSSYDHTVRIWDMRIEADQACVHICNHGAPVTSTLLLPAGSLLVSAGDTSIKIWDLMGGARQTHTMSNHQKTITSLSIDHLGPSRGASTATAARLLSGSLDHFVKVYDLITYDVTHSMKYDQPILSMGLSPHHNTMVVGCVDGTVYMRRKLKPWEQKTNNVNNEDISDDLDQIDEAEKLERTNIANRSSFQAEDSLKKSRISPEGPQSAKKKRKANWMERGMRSIPSSDDFRVESIRKSRLQPYDTFLKKFQYHAALDNALLTNEPIVVCTMLHELILRNALHVAIASRSESTLGPLVKFLVAYLTHPAFSGLLLDVCTLVLDMYSHVLGQSIWMDELMTRLNQRLDEECTIQDNMQECVGLIGMLTHANSSMHNKSM